MGLFSQFVRVTVVAGAGVALSAALVAPPARLLLSAGESGDDLLDLSPLSERSVVYGRDGSVIAVLHAEENRSPVKLDEVPQHVVNAILDVEDSAFYEHGALDFRSALRAAYTNVREGGLRQGGSTITQQLVKNALLTPERDLQRKIKEAVLAVRLEQQLSKDEILEHYLNTVYFGNGVYGVQAASELYFGVDVGEIDVAQAALLAGIIRSPVEADPFDHPEVARARRNLALDRMVAQRHVSPAEATRLADAPMPDKPFKLLPPPDNYFVEEVKQRLLDDKRLGETPQERYNAVFKGGLRIFTTLDPTYQRVAEQKIHEILPDTKGRFTAALVSVDPRSGAVRALVGGPGFEQSKYNIVTQGLGRQPGSSWKPFTLVAALEQGYSPKDTISGSSPCTIPNPGGDPDPWRPTNYEGSGGGTMTLAKGLAKSSNCAFARLAMLVGVGNVAETARRMGITTQVDAVPAMSLGSEEVHPLDMASAYGVLAADGLRYEPYFVERVETPDGTKLVESEPNGSRVVAQQVSRMAVDMMRGVVDGGTGTRARLRDRPVAGKTGTAQNWEDAWFVGFTPQLSTAVWMGAPVGKVPMRNVGGVRVTGGSFPARIWGSYMTEIMRGREVVPFPSPDPKLVPKGKYRSLKGEKPARRSSSTRPRRSPTTVPSSPTATAPSPPPEPAPAPSPEPAPAPAPAPAESPPAGQEKKESP